MSQAIHASFFRNFVARGSQGFIGQSSPNVAHIVEQPPVLNKFFFIITVEFYLYPTVGTVLIHSVKPELTE